MDKYPSLEDAIGAPKGSFAQHLKDQLAEEKALEPSATTACSHRNRRDVGDTAEGMGHIIIHWCPDCGALKRTMTNWKCTDYPWETPSRANA